MSNFLAALKAKSASLNTPALEIKPAPIQNYLPPSVDPLSVRVELVANRQRIDLFFNRKPEPEVLQELKNQGFWFRRDDLAWYHQDNNDNRVFLNSYFGTSLEMHPKPLPPVEVAPMKLELEDPNLTTHGTTDEPVEYSPEFLKYKQQVNELATATGKDVIDVLFSAIACYHRSIFN